MTVELRPLGVKCNLACHYCYQNPQREAENYKKSYDMNKMKAALLKEGRDFSIFGGEALLVPIEDLEDLWYFGYENFGKNSIQTNGTLITSKHIELFKKYNVSVGISIDGPGELNDIRWANSLEQTRKLSQQTMDNIKLLLKNQVRPGLIITLHKYNASKDKLERMAQWFSELDELGIKSARLHLLEVENSSVRDLYSLSIEENINALLFFNKLSNKLKNLRFDIFDEITSLLLANDIQVSCTWKACDPFTTDAVRGIEGNGQASNCGRTNKEGIDFVKDQLPSYMRYISLYHTEQSQGGCKGCRFFLMCKGHCPGTSLAGDWRNKTEHCEIWKKLFEIQEKAIIQAGKVPLSKFKKLKELEECFIDAWSQGKNPSIYTTLKQAEIQAKKEKELENASC